MMNVPSGMPSRQPSASPRLMRPWNHTGAGPASPKASRCTASMSIVERRRRGEEEERKAREGEGERERGEKAEAERECVCV